MSERLPTHVPEVTDRQLEVARLVAAGYTNERIAQELGITHDGAKYHVSELLGRLGFERREEITTWYRAEHGSVVARTRRRLRGLTLLPAGLVAGGAVVGVAALVLLIVAFEGAMGGESDATSTATTDESEPVTLERGEASDVPVAEYVHEHSGDRWETRAATNLGERDLIFLVWHGGLAEIHAIDVDSGERVGEVLLDWDRAMVTRADGRLVVSPAGSQPPQSASDPENAFLIFDIDAGLALEAEVQAEGILPLSRTPGVRGPMILEQGESTLSRDGRYLYYVATRESAMDTVGVIDLDDGARIVATNQDACANGGLSPAEADSIFAVCHRNGTIRTLAPDGALGPEIEVGEAGGYLHDVEPGGTPVRRAEEEGGLPNFVVAATATSAGISVVYSDGTRATGDANGVTVTGRVLPPDALLLHLNWRGDVFTLDGDRIVLPYYLDSPFVDGDTPIPPLGGLVVVNAATGTIEFDFAIEHWGSYPIGDDRIAIVGQHRIDIFDLGTMQLERAFALVHPAPVADAGDLSWNPAVR